MPGTAVDQDESGTTTCVASPLPSPSNAEPKASCSKAGRLEEIPKNFKELLATSLLNGQRVKYIMKKGKIRWSGRWRRELGMTAKRRTSAGEDVRARAWSSWRRRGRGRQLGTRRAVQSREPSDSRQSGDTVPGSLRVSAAAAAHHRWWAASGRR